MSGSGAQICNRISRWKTTTFFHPSYVGCSSYFMTQAAMYYTYAGRPFRKPPRII